MSGPLRDIFLVRLTTDAAALTLRVEPAGHRCFIEGAGFAISHVEQELPRSLAEALRRTLASLSGNGDEEGLQRLLEALSRLGIPELMKRWPSNQAVPRWPVSLRSGVPRLGEGLPWPFDAELSGLLRGARRLIFREALDAAGAQSDVEWLRTHGVETRILFHEGRHAVIAAEDANALHLAEEHLPHIGSTEETARAMGTMLGYPECCIEAFTTSRRRDDLMLFSYSIPSWPHPARPADLVTLNGALPLVSHAACRPDCAATLQLARENLSTLEQAHPGFHSAWSRWARQLHAIDVTGAQLVLETTHDGSRVERAFHFEPAAGELSITEDAHLNDVRLSHGLLQLESPDLPGWRATLVADHRA